MKTRREQDLLGERDIPANVYWGINTARAVENFPISGRTINDVPGLIRAMVEVKKAEALANREARILPAEKSAAIVAACDRILDEGVAMDQFPVDVFQGGAGTSVNMNTNEVVANLALESMGETPGDYARLHPNDDVNKSQSTNDTYPTALRVAAYREVIALCGELNLLATAFETLAEKYASTIKMGRTQLQDAIPMSVGQEFGAFAELMHEEVSHLTTIAALLLEVNLGATAIGTGVNTPPGFQDLVVGKFAQVTELPVRAGRNLVEATSDCGAYLAVHGALRRTAMKLSKVCNDLRLLSSGPRAGLNEINLPQVQAGSSIMPAKVNPVIPEVVNQVCFKVMGNDTTVMIASEAGQLQLNVMEPVIAQCLFESTNLLNNAVKNLRTRCVDGITVNEQVCYEDVVGSVGIVTYLNEIIGHHAGDQVGRDCIELGLTVPEAVVRRGLMSREEVDELLSPQRLLNPVYTGMTYE